VLKYESDTKLSPISKIDVCSKEKQRYKSDIYRQVYTKNSLQTGSLNKVTGQS